MGVYVFMSKVIPVIKIGHYSKTNPWSKIAHRGFYSCTRPHEIANNVSIDDLDLLCWFPDLKPKDKKRIHKHVEMYKIIGEWFELEALSYIPDCIPDNMLDECNKLDTIKSHKEFKESLD